MSRYCVNATVTFDAWTYVEAETREDALEQAQSLGDCDFELGDPFEHDIVSVEEEA